MISIAKAVTSVPDTFNSVIDTGISLIIGGKYYNKDLTEGLKTETFAPQQVGSLQLFPVQSNTSTSTPYYGYGTMVSPMFIRGNSSLNYINQTTAGVATKASVPASVQTRQADVYSPYFDSIMGTSAGKRFVVLPRLSLYQVQASGSLSLLSNTTVDDSTVALVGEPSTMIFAESTQYLWVLRCLPYAWNLTNNFNYSIWRISKADWSMSVQTAAGQGLYRNVRFMGITADNKAVLAIFPHNSPRLNDNIMSYLSVDLTSNVLSLGSPFFAAFGPATTLSGVGICPSSLTTDLQDTTSQKYYYPVVGSASTTATTFVRVRTPKNWGAKTSVVAGDVQACTIDGLPTPIPNCSNTPVGTVGSSECTLLTHVVGSNEYLLVINHAQDAATLQVGSLVANYCDSTRVGVWVFLVDPTNSANLIWKQTLLIADLGDVIPYAVNCSIDRNLLVLGGLTQFSPLKWNQTSETFSVGKTVSIPAGVQRIAVDDQSQIIVQDFANKLFFFQLDNSLDVNIQFENNVSSVNYSGTPVTVNIVVNCYDMVNNRVAKTISLNLQGGVFTASNSANASVVTSATVDTLVNLTITSAGQIVVTPISVT